VKADSVNLTPAEVEQVRAMKATAAIVMHYTGDGWTDAQIAALRHQFGELGIDVIAVTDAGFEPDRQVSDIETVLARKPDIIVSIPTDPVATAGAYKQAAAAGVRLIFMDNAPSGMVAGRDYVSAVSADNVGNGVVAAHLMADALGGRGEIGVIYHEADFKVTRQRYEGFTQTILITTEDLGPNVAIALASGELVAGLGAQRPFDQGVTEATLAAYALLGKQAPPYVALDALPVTQDNVLDAWREVYRSDPPATVAESVKGGSR
jgi:ribose transport system substrate-binding protein